ncbi:alpha-L-arabinofuranosidase C-terminal domain-containing protein [Gaoshiqia sp. Z1-71]|uniref:alpha-L-arabinofuranosidase C-terminal domain-containing protein n=1 Tax=Gaoshiqia hydrogeniformans TaxID=3290090 RepID=UPI003BF7D238
MQKTIASGIFILTFFLQLQVFAQSKITVYANRPTAEIAPTMWGVFFEDINFAADGGIYAELVKNRSFKFPDPFAGWKVPFRDSVQVINETIDGKEHRFLRLSSLAGENANYIENQGFRGMGLHAGEEYRLVLGSKAADGIDLSLLVELLNEAGEPIGKAVVSGLATDWNMKELVIMTTAASAKGRLRISLKGEGTVDFDYVSLFPVNTFKKRVNGMRSDLAQLLADLKPGFLRFPGGCVVEGHHLDLRYQWKKTVGDIHDRELIINRWNTEFMHRHTPDYFQSFGLGFFEYFVLSEDLGAEPLPILNCGMACQYNTGELVPLNEMDPYIQDALDLIEFANGDVSTKWGKLRADMGHPEPFNLKYIGIGNEQWGHQYLERYDLIAAAVRERYPEIQLVSGSGPSAEGDRFDYLWNELKGRQADLVDEHYYKDPNWFFNNARRYDSYERGGLKVFAGEYASHVRNDNIKDATSSNCWLAALSEAAFMTGLERNADVVHMASYAPLFAHVDAWQWRPDLIWFDNLNAVATPNYYVQKMYSTHSGTHVLPVLLGNEVIAGQDSLYASASIDKNSGHIYLKIVNASSVTKEMLVEFQGMKPAVKEALLTELADQNLMQYNTLDQPENIVPQNSKAALKGNQLSLALNPRSFVLVDVTGRK